MVAKVRWIFLLLLSTLFEVFDRHVDATTSSLLTNVRGYKSAMRDANNWHFAMMNDKARNAAYYHALKEAIIPGESVVLDIGSGMSGLLSMMAVRLGARKVFAVEENQAIAIIASETIERNGLSSKIKLSICSSFHLDYRPLSHLQHDCSISERATILVSEVLSTSLIGEGVLRTVEDARRRLCVPNATIIPLQASLIVALVHSYELFYSSHVSHWGGFDLRPANILRNAHKARLVDLSKISDKTYLTKKTVVLQLDFSSPLLGHPTPLLSSGDQQFVDKVNGEYKKSIHVNTTSSGESHFLCSWFSLTLFHDIKINTDPEEQVNNRMRQRHWGQSCTSILEREDIRRSDKTVSKDALIVCSGQEVQITTAFDTVELKPEPRFSVILPTRKKCLD